MPDPAIEAINAGLPYTEPTPGGLFGRKGSKAKVSFVANPNDPTAPPRRIVDVDGGGSGSGLFKRKWGGASGSRPMPQLGLGAGQTSSHSAAQGLGMAPSAAPFDPLTPGAMPFPTFGPAGAGSQSMMMQPLPEDFWQLSWRQRRQLRKMQAREKNAAWDWEKAQKDWEKAQRIDMEKKNKEAYRKRKAELKCVFVYSARC